jgi:cyclic pyranopterin phosphate synthase
MSITDRCNFRCIYCMEPTDRFLPKQALLSSSEYIMIVDAAISLGVRKVRLTGGEPTLYPELDTIISELGRRDLDDIAMTTNGSLIDAARTARWKSAGLNRLTFSLDTLREDRMTAITRSKTRVEDVLQSIDIAAAAGFPQSKINVVAMRGVNEDEFADFADLARERDLDIRFIEFMPLDSGRLWKPESVVSETEIIASIKKRHRLEQRDSQNPHSTSRHYQFADGSLGRIGVIASVTRPFCGACNRLRVTAEGAVRPCLFSNTEWDIRPLLRRGGGHDDIVRFLVDSVWTKQAGHGIGLDDFEQPDRGMSAIGG